MSIKKQYFKTKPYCKVSLSLSKLQANSAKKVYVVGDFNEWKLTSHPMKARKDGSFKANLKLPLGNAYQFRYYIDNTYWENDSEADDYRPNNYSGESNSVVIV